MTQENNDTANKPAQAAQQPTAPSASDEALKQAHDARVNELKHKAGSAVSGFFQRCYAMPAICTRKIDAGCDWVEKSFPAGLFVSVSQWFARLGHIGLVFAGMVGVAFTITAAIQAESFSVLIYGLCAIVLLAVVQYVAEKFLGAIDGLINSTPGYLQSPAFMRCMAVISEAFSVVVLINAIIIALQSEEIRFFWMGLGLSITLETVAFIALHPVLTSTNVVRDAPAGEEAIAIASFFVKLLLRLLPICFGIGVVIGTVLLAINTIGMIAGKAVFPDGFRAIRIIFAVGLLPIVAYVIYALFCLLVELLRAVLSVRKR